VDRFVSTGRVLVDCLDDAEAPVSGVTAAPEESMSVDPQAPAGTVASNQITREELQLATRNHGMPLEAMRYDITPIGLHYLLIHYDIPHVDPATWSLNIGGAVERPTRYALEELQSRQVVTHTVTMECAGNGRARLSPRALSQPWLHEAVSTGEWTGTPLWPLLEEAHLRRDVVDIVFAGLDRGVEGGMEQRYERSMTVEQVHDEDALLVWALNGAPLPPQHGFPLRLLVPGWYGMASVKWLTQITALTEPFAGYQQATAYRYRAEPEDVGEPITRMQVRSLMIPAGIPDFFTRQRHLAPGPVRLEGRAWSGNGPISRVEVSVDGGEHWTMAELEEPTAPHAWQRWWLTWDAPPGTHDLVCRAGDVAGYRQPLEHRWNAGGYAVNTVQRVRVVVTPEVGGD
jgi:DMSO/TMAO reductase YedYZ molybdopterin-dependent catalytic subunit